MALKISLTSSQGIDCTEAYLRVNEVRYSTAASGPSQVLIVAEIFYNQNARTSNNAPVEKRHFSLTSEPDNEEDKIIFSTYFALAVLDTKNPVKAAYDYLKSLSEFTGSTDV